MPEAAGPSFLNLNTTWLDCVSIRSKNSWDLPAATLLVLLLVALLKEKVTGLEKVTASAPAAEKAVVTAAKIAVPIRFRKELKRLGVMCGFMAVVGSCEEVQMEWDSKERGSEGKQTNWK